MKRWIATLLILVLCFSFLVGFQNRKTDLYENMVDASVVLWGNGSGVFIDDDVILTAAHCLKGVNSLTIKLRDGTTLKSSDFYMDKEEDIAFVFVKADELGIVKVSSVPVNIGDPVYLVGAPGGGLFIFSLTKGIVSHLNRDFPSIGWKNLIQTDAEGGPGSSGGPLYNSYGNLVGMYVGHSDEGGRGISLCESAKSILEAYERCMESRNAPD